MKIISKRERVEIVEYEAETNRLDIYFRELALASSSQDEGRYDSNEPSNFHSVAD